MEGRQRLILGLSAAVVVVALIAAIATKGGDSTPAGTGSTASTQAQSQDQAEAPVVSKSTDLAVKPVVPIQSGSTPGKLVTSDIVTGTGPAAKDGDTLTMKYVGVLWSNGKQFDASWDRPAPQDVFTFTLGKGEVIPGWDKGLVGMKVGGRRQLSIPADLGYGAAGAPPSIPPNSALVFVVDLKKIG